MSPKEMVCRRLTKGREEPHVQVILHTHQHELAGL